MSVEQGAGADGHLALGALDTLVLRLHQIDLGFLFRMTIERMFLDVLLVRTDVTTQLTGIFQTLVNSPNMIGQLISLSGLEITASAL